MMTRRRLVPTTRYPLTMVALILIAFFAVATAHAQPVFFADASAQLATFTHSSVPFGGDGLAGAAWFDFDNDGFLDLYLTNGKTQLNALFRNNGNGTFTNVAAAAGVQNGGGNSGAIAADLDNDGDQDLFLTGDGGMMGSGDSRVVLFRNNGNGTFTNVTAGSGINPPTTNMSAAFGDINNDGLLDLFIAASGSLCLTAPSPPCVPGVHANGLYLNNGGLTFTNISAGSGVNTALGACSTFFGHYDNDPWIDLFVGNCNNNVAGAPIPGPIQVFRNNANLTFTDVAPGIGIAVPGLWMGFGPADIDNDLNIDIFATNMGSSLPPFLNALFYKVGPLCPTPTNNTYVDVAPAVIPNLPNVEFGWGVTLKDFDNDGYSDIFFAGALPQAGVIGPGLGNPGKLFFNNLPAVPSFTDWSASLPASINLSNKFSSGVAAADYDNDGDVDIVVATDTFVPVPPPNNGQPVLLNNQGNDANSWLTVRLQGTVSNRDGIGARIAVGNGVFIQIKGVYAGSSFLSMDSQWQTFGLGAAAVTNVLAVWWPSGVIESFPNVAANQTVTLVEGTGTVLPPC